MAAKQAGDISDDAVRAKTGRDWADWCAHLDSLGLAKATHKEIVAAIRAAGAGQWWQQMIAGQYERARGLRVRHEMPDGFQIGVSKTFQGDVAVLWPLLADPQALAHQAGLKGLEPRKSVPEKLVRFAISGSPERLEVAFFPKPEGKTQVTIQHRKLPDADAAAHWKERWRTILDQLGPEFSGAAGPGLA